MLQARACPPLPWLDNAGGLKLEATHTPPIPTRTPPIPTIALPPDVRPHGIILFQALPGCNRSKMSQITTSKVFLSFITGKNE